MASPSADAIGEMEALAFLADLVRIAPTNLEDPAHGRFEKPNYPAAAERIVAQARAWGLHAEVFDPVAESGSATGLRGIPRPNIIVDLDAGAASTVLILAHYDVVPVPAEQRSRWRTPPHELTPAADGRLYGRGANDDLGSGVTASLLAMRRLRARGRIPSNVRLLVCCDEETQGEGGIEAIKHHDDQLPRGDRRRRLLGDVALIPDGSPHTTVGSSGVAFLEAGFAVPVALSTAVGYGRFLVGLDAVARDWTSTMASPDWPDFGAPAPVILGRATVTQMDFEVAAPPPGGTRLERVHAETDAANQIAESVTLVFGGEERTSRELEERLAAHLPAPFRVAAAVASALTIPPGRIGLQVVGKSAHGGYPHRGRNPVPAVLDLLASTLHAGVTPDAPGCTATYTVDLRLPPEMDLESAVREVRGRTDAWIERHAPAARLSAPEGRRRAGYALDPAHPAAQRLEGILGPLTGERGMFGEYGGTDASSLRGIPTPAGAPLPALVFGSMDRAANIHEANESADPKLIGAVAQTIERFVLEG
ncbi:MAG TPA: M20/M25/M40 family metallo-hydrolase [Thermoplasmata archaeon]|nr:M20/M25/M40 family metallo-hydrolase [Thermoplasmata archaeon]